MLLRTTTNGVVLAKTKKHLSIMLKTGSTIKTENHYPSIRAGDKLIIYLNRATNTIRHVEHIECPELDDTMEEPIERVIESGPLEDTPELEIDLSLGGVLGGQGCEGEGCSEYPTLNYKTMQTHHNFGE